MEITTAPGAGNGFARDYPEVLTERELLDCRGGQIPPAFWWSIGSLIISNWQDIREGFSDGIANKPPRHAN